MNHLANLKVNVMSPESNCPPVNRARERVLAR